MLLNNNLKVLRAVDGVIDLAGKQGTTWGPLTIALIIGGSPADLTGYSVRGQMRKQYNSARAETGLIFAITDPTGGVVSMSMSDVDSAAISCGATAKDSASAYVWDMEIYKDSPKEVSRFFGGRIFIDPEVTR
jgi:hypothetical protein